MELGQIGIVAALALAAIGSVLGISSAGMAAIGAAKRAYLSNRKVPFQLIIFSGMPLSQTIYGFILMGQLSGATDVDPYRLFAIGILGGIAIGFSGWFQGKAGASACDSFGETGKGFVQNITILGLVEVIALFTMVFMFGLL